MRRRLPTEETCQKISDELKQRGAQKRITPDNALIGFFNWRICDWVIEQEMKCGETI